MSLRSCGACVVILAAVIPAGCAGKGVTPVRGVLTLDGKPVAGATVLFMPEGEEGGRPASGFTLPDGTFQLTTFKTDDGALAGTYRVLVQKTEAAKDRYAAEQAALERAKAKYEDRSAQKGRKSALPEVYAKFDTTPLRCTVPVTGQVAFDLHKDGKR
jgi:hypothetical protein